MEHLLVEKQSVSRIFELREDTFYKKLDALSQDIQKRSDLSDIQKAEMKSKLVEEHKEEEQ